MSDAGTAAPAGIVSDLWRFPVKSLGGERTRRAFVGPFGLLGDRHHAVVDESGAPLTARRAHRMLGFGARCADHDTGEGARITTPSGATLAWDDPAAAAELTAVLGAPVEVIRSPVSVHDAAPVHLVSTTSLDAAGAWADGEPLDRRRFRPNLVVEPDDDEPFAEGAWVGRALAIDGGVVLEVVSPTERCAVPTFDPDTLERDNRVLAGLARERDNFFGVYARVARPGWVEVGARLRLLPAA